MNAFSEKKLRKEQNGGGATAASAVDHRDLDQHKFEMTFFKSKSGTKLIKDRCRKWTLPELYDHIRQHQLQGAAKKLDLPWLQFTAVGNVRSNKYSLRTHANTLSITGIPLDFDGTNDGKVMSFEEAIETITRMKVRAILYTTPSHTAAAPRWRALMPFSESIPRSKEKKPKEAIDELKRQHMKYVARANGYFGNIFAGESFTMSQAYVYGRRLDMPDPGHQAIVIDGDFIDLRDNLQQYEAIGAKAKGKKTDSKNADGKKINKFEFLLAAIGDGEGRTGFRENIRNAIGCYIAAHGSAIDRERLEAIICDTIDKAPKGPNRNPADIERYKSDKELDEMIEGAIAKGFGEKADAVSIDDFIAYSPQHNYIFIPTRELWPGAGVNSRVPPVQVSADSHIAANVWIDRNRAVEQMTWAPGEPLEIRDRLMASGGWFNRKGATCFNLYRPPTIVHGDPSKATMWIALVRKVYPDDADHIINYCAHYVQHPQIKINHSILMGGEPGIGKDTILEPFKRAVGPWNFQETSPKSMTGQFNSYLQCVILRISELADLGESNRYSFYEQLKTIAAAPPDVHRINDKYLKEYYVLNCNGTIITSNHKTDGIYLPHDDRRTYVAWSNCTKENFNEADWNKIWHWYNNGGDGDVAAYLATKDLTDFNPKKPPKKTEAFWTIVNSNMAPEQSELADVLDVLRHPEVVTIERIQGVLDTPQFITCDLRGWLQEKKNRRLIPNRMGKCGYVPVRNPDAKDDGLWKINKKRRAVYAKNKLSFQEQLAAIKELMERAAAKREETAEADAKEKAAREARMKVTQANLPQREEEEF